MGKITGFLEIERQRPRLRAGRRAPDTTANSSLPLPRRSDAATRPRAAWIAASRSATSGCPVNNLIPTGTLVHHDSGRSARATCTRPTTSRNSPAASARRPARPPARSTSTTTRSPSRPSNARSSTAAGRRLDRAAAAGGQDRQAVAVVGSGPAGLACAQQLARAGHDVPCSRSTPRPAACCATAFPTSRWRSTSSTGASRRWRPRASTFHHGVHVGVDVPAEELLDELRRRGAGRRRRAAARPAGPRPRADGIHFAMDFLPQQNKRVARRDRRSPTSRSSPTASMWW